MALVYREDLTLNITPGSGQGCQLDDTFRRLPSSNVVRPAAGGVGQDAVGAGLFCSTILFVIGRPTCELSCVGRPFFTRRGCIRKEG